MIAPSANQLVHVGSETHIQWVTLNISRTKSVKVDLLHHNGSDLTLVAVVADSTLNTGSLSWHVPVDIKQARMKKRHLFVIH